MTNYLLTFPVLHLHQNHKGRGCSKAMLIGCFDSCCICLLSSVWCETNTTHYVLDATLKEYLSKKRLCTTSIQYRIDNKEDTKKKSYATRNTKKHGPKTNSSHSHQRRSTVHSHLSTEKYQSPSLPILDDHRN